MKMIVSFSTTLILHMFYQSFDSLGFLANIAY